jgi:hypothetical protein
VQALHTKNLMVHKSFCLLTVNILYYVTCYGEAMVTLSLLEWATQQKNSDPSPITPLFYKIGGTYTGVVVVVRGWPIRQMPSHQHGNEQF